MTHKMIATLLLAACLPAWAGLEGNELSRKLVREGHVARQEGKLQEALDKYQAAARADGTASFPLSSIADLLYGLSEGAAPPRKDKLREQAGQAAGAALQNAPDDPVAHEVLRKLNDDTQEPRHAGNAAAEKAHTAAETAFAQRDWDTALKHYRDAMAADPHYAAAFVGAGDCYYVQQQWPQAEDLFRQAVAIEPRNSQAWRFLSDALANQGKFDAAEDALLSAIAAHPSQLPNWNKLGALRAQRGQPSPVPLDLVPMARVSIVDGKGKVDVDKSLMEKHGPFDMAVALAQAMATVVLRQEHPDWSPFKVELESWNKAMTVADELTAKDGKTLHDPAMLKMQEFYRRNQLDAALLLLRYREAYRADLDKWLAARPHPVREFIAAWNVRP